MEQRYLYPNPKISIEKPNHLSMNFLLLAGKNILVVEDNSINQMLVKHALSKSEATIHIANNGTEALEFIHANSYDVILMDIHMPELDGYQTTQIIRNELHLNIPIIAMTALAIRGEDERCISIGMNGYVPKPFTMQSLYAELERVLETTSYAQTNVHQLSDGNMHIDLSLLNKLAGNDNAYIKTMINLFLDNMPNTLNKLQQYHNDSDWDNVFRTAHYAKSSLSVIKIRQMYEIAEQIENIAKSEKNTKKTTDLIVEINNYYAKAKYLLNKELNELSTISKVA